MNTNHDNMATKVSGLETDTPETDAACDETYAQGVAHIPLVGFMEKLERERDEARRIAEKWARAAQDCKWPKETLPWDSAGISRVSTT